MSIKPVRLVLSEAVIDARPFGDGTVPFPDAVTLAGLEFVRADLLAGGYPPGQEVTIERVQPGGPE